MFKYRLFNAAAPGLTERRQGTLTPPPVDNISETLDENEDNPFPHAGEEGPTIRVKDIFRGLFSHHENHSSNSASVEVEHYIHDKSFRQRMILLSLSNSKLGIRFHYFRFFYFFIGCLLYLTEAIYYDHVTEEKIGVNLAEDCNFDADTSEYHNATFLLCVRLQLKALFIVGSKPYVLWLLQLFLSVGVVGNAAMIVYITTDGTCRGFLKSLDFTLSVMFFIPGLFLLTMVYPPVLKDFFIPSFLYCWPAARSLSTAVVQSLQRKVYRIPNNFKLEMVRLVIFLVCFVFTWVSVIHHIFRNDIQTDFFDTFWFIMVTMSTVGYGDYSPIAWPGKAVVILFIITAILYLIPRLEELYQSFQIQQKLNSSISLKESGDKFILICSVHLEPIVLRDFLTEFYSDPTHYAIHCVLLVEHELASIAQTYLSHPVWAQRISVLIGSPLRLADLRRARAANAMACFIHTDRAADPETGDQHTIMCAWSIKDYAPRCKLYVQILKPENRLHLGVADHIVVEGELKHALLANNSHCPGISTLVTLLLHTFKAESNPMGTEDSQFYGQCAPVEVYDSCVKESLYFHHFIGKNFLYSAVVAFRRYHVTLIGVRAQGSAELKLNPGLTHILQENDTVFYIGFTREEYSKVRGPINVRHTLWHACATWAVLAMATSGINPYELEQKYGSHEVKMDQKGEGKLDNEKEDAESLGEEKDVQFFVGDGQFSEADAASTQKRPSLISEGSHEDKGSGTATSKEGSPDDQLKCDMMRGVQLLRFHSQANVHSSIPVKVNLLHRDSTATAPCIDKLSQAPASAQSSTHKLHGSTHKLNQKPQDQSPAHKASGTGFQRQVSGPQTGLSGSTNSSRASSLSGGMAQCNSVHPLYQQQTSSSLSRMIQGVNDSEQPHDSRAQRQELGDATEQFYPSCALPTTKAAQWNFTQLSDVPEESPTERSPFKGGEKVDVVSRIEAAYSLRDAEEGRVMHNQNGGIPGWQQSIQEGCGHMENGHGTIRNGIPKVSHTMSVPEVPVSRKTLFGNASSKRSSSSLVPPPLDLTRSTSDGGLASTLEEAYAAAKPVEPTTLRRGGYYSSELSLLSPGTPCSASRHVEMPFPQNRRETIMSNLSRKLSQVAPPIIQEETESVLQLELDDLNEQKELVDIEGGYCESSSESDSDSSISSDYTGSIYTGTTSSSDEGEEEGDGKEEEAKKEGAAAQEWINGVLQPIISPITEEGEGHHHHGHHHHGHHHHGHQHHGHHHHHHHRHQYEKGTLPVPPYLGFEASKLHLLLQQRTRGQTQLIPEDDSKAPEGGGLSMREEVVEQCAHSKAVIVYSNEASDELYHFILPLRAHYLHASLLKPLVIMLDQEPDNSFVETIAWLPLVYYLVGRLSSIDHWLKAGIMLADTAVILCNTKLRRSEDEQEHMVDASHIMAVQKLSTLFPQVSIVTDIHYRFNIRFMKYAERNVFIANAKNALARRGDHLLYLFLPPFAAGHAFCSSMLDTLLYQSHVKPYIIDVIRQLLGCKQVPGSGFLWKTAMTPELLRLQTYDRVFQRLVSTHKEIPLGIYRTSEASKKDQGGEGEVRDELEHDGERVNRFLAARMNSLGLDFGRVQPPGGSMEVNQHRYVLPNPPPKTQLRPTDIILVLRGLHTPHTHVHFASHVSHDPEGTSPYHPPACPPPSALGEEEFKMDGGGQTQMKVPVLLESETLCHESAGKNSYSSEFPCSAEGKSFVSKEPSPATKLKTGNDASASPVEKKTVEIKRVIASPTESSTPKDKDSDIPLDVLASSDAQTERASMPKDLSPLEKERKSSKRRKAKKNGDASPRKRRKRGLSTSSSEDSKTSRSRTVSESQDTADLDVSTAGCSEGAVDAEGASLGPTRHEGVTSSVVVETPSPATRSRGNREHKEGRKRKNSSSKRRRGQSSSSSDDPKSSHNVQMPASESAPGDVFNTVVPVAQEEDEGCFTQVPSVPIQHRPPPVKFQISVTDYDFSVC